MADHDQLFKELLRTFFPDFLALVAPELGPEVSTAAFHFLQPEVYADWPHGSMGEVDLLARTERGEGCTLLIHTEVESSFNTDAIRRLKRYFHLLMARYDEPVFPILVNLRGGPAGVRRLAIDGKIGEHAQVFAYTSFGLSGCRASEYLERPEPLAWGLAALMQPGDGGRVEQKLACYTRIALGQLSEIQVFALVNCVASYIQLNAEETAAFERLWSLEANEEVRVMELTWADRMRAEGIQIGLEKGREQGREEGLEKGLESGLEKGLKKGREEGLSKGLEMTRQLLARILQQRFGDLPATSRRRLAAVRSLERLNRLAEQVLTARSLDDLGLA